MSLVPIMNKNAISTQLDLSNKSDQSNHTDNKRKKVYVVGNGWASYYFCKNLDKSKYEPIIIAPNEKVLNTTKLIDLIFDETVSAEFPNPHAKIINGKLLNIDFSNKKLILYDDQEIKFDSEPIVLAIGSEVNDYGIDGVKTHGYFLKTKDDAYKLLGIFKGKVISTNKKIHGVYDKLGGARIESEWWGGLVMQYHKHIHHHPS